MENILPDFTSFQVEKYEQLSSHWHIDRNIVPPLTPERLRHILPHRATPRDDRTFHVESQLPLPAPNDRYVESVYTGTSPSPLSVAERGKCEPFSLVLEPAEPVTMHAKEAVHRADGRRQCRLTVSNVLNTDFTLFVQKKSMPASWSIGPNASQDVILIGDHHTKIQSTPIGLACCVGTAASTIHPNLQESITLVVQFLPEQLGLHVQYLEGEQAVRREVLP